MKHKTIQKFGGQRRPRHVAMESKRTRNRHPEWECIIENERNNWYIIMVFVRKIVERMCGTSATGLTWLMRALRVIALVSWGIKFNERKKKAVFFSGRDQITREHSIRKSHFYISFSMQIPFTCLFWKFMEFKCFTAFWTSSHLTTHAWGLLVLHAHCLYSSSPSNALIWWSGVDVQNAWLVPIKILPFDR